MGLVVCALLASAFVRTAKYVHIAALVVVPALTLGILNLVRMYPIGYLRLTLFMLPSIAIGLTLVVEIIWRTVLKPISPTWLRERLFGARPASWHWQCWWRRW